jgi:hypothetical protein
MRAFLSLISLGSLPLLGCADHRGGSTSFTEVPIISRPAVALSYDKLIMTPDLVLVGKVSKVNQEGRFVVMTFPIGHLPILDQRLNLYRRGLKVGEIKVTGPQLDDSVIGDIAIGEAQPGDEVRAQ